MFSSVPEYDGSENEQDEYDGRINEEGAKASNTNSSMIDMLCGGGMVSFGLPPSPRHLEDFDSDDEEGTLVSEVTMEDQISLEQKDVYSKGVFIHDEATAGVGEAADPCLLPKKELNQDSAPIPCSTSSPSPSTSRSPLLSPLEASLTQNFATEHRILLRALLSLLAERDAFLIEANANDPPLKTGPLRKAAVPKFRHATKIPNFVLWKVKYVEIRRGFLTYYEDSTSETLNPKRKSVPLRATMCTCRAVKLKSEEKLVVSVNKQKNSGFVFELTVEGSPRRLWMANSREERQGWIHAIHEAMVGGSVIERKRILDYSRSVENLRGKGKHRSVSEEVMKWGILPDSPYRNDLEEYVYVMRDVKASTDEDTYRASLLRLFNTSLTVPVQWIKEQVEVSDSSAQHTNFPDFKDVSQGIAQLWKDMLRDSVEINEIVYKGDEGHGPERIVGALATEIRNFDRKGGRKIYTKQARKFYRMTDLQIVSYARDVLLACNRTTSGGDSYYCVDHLCSMPQYMCLVPYSGEAKPLSIAVNTYSQGAGTNHNLEQFNGLTASTSMEDWSTFGITHDSLSGWLKIRHGVGRSWKKRFGVLSEGVFSYYEKDKPRPHGLRGQLVLLNATMGVSQVGNKDKDKNIEKESNANSINTDTANAHATTVLPEPPPADTTPTSSLKKKSTTKYIICIVTKDKNKERQLCFERKHDFFIWKEAIQNAIQTDSTSLSLSDHDKADTGPTKRLITLLRRDTKGHANQDESLEDHNQHQQQEGTTRLKALLHVTKKNEHTKEHDKNDTDISGESTHDTATPHTAAADGELTISTPKESTSRFKTFFQGAKELSPFRDTNAHSNFFKDNTAVPMDAQTHPAKTAATFATIDKKEHPKDKIDRLKKKILKKSKGSKTKHPSPSMSCVSNNPMESVIDSSSMVPPVGTAEKSNPDGEIPPPIQIPYPKMSDETPESRLQSQHGDLPDINDRAPTNDHLLKSPDASPPRNKKHNSHYRSSVRIQVRASAFYKICTLDPDGVPEEDTWCTLQTQFLQSFRLSGGPNGRMVRGEEVVEMKFLDGLVNDLNEFNNEGISRNDDKTEAQEEEDEGGDGGL